MLGFFVEKSSVTRSCLPVTLLTILAIESSCDETAAAVICNGEIKSNVIATQEIHAKYGGVVPEIASRAHLEAIVPVVTEALQTAGIAKKELHAIAFTEAPGLIGSLLVGASFAKSMALALDIPLIGVHHMQAHVLAHLIEDPKPPFPFLCLTVSGGHTQIVQVNSPLHMEVLGSTLDDAAGEAFDKVAKMLQLPYPGGPLVDKMAREGNPGMFPFPPAQIPGLDFSFSGIKTAVRYFLEKETRKNADFITENRADICASVQSAIVGMLMDKVAKAAAQTGIKHIGIAGGVSANSALRKALSETGRQQGWETYIPAFVYCTDNAAMIAITAHYLYEAGRFAPMDAAPSPRAAF